jgi:hypothetical protein
MRRARNLLKIGTFLFFCHTDPELQVHLLAVGLELVALLRLFAELQTTIHAVHGLPSPLLRMMFFSTGLHRNPRVEHVTTVRTVSNGDGRAPMIQIGTGLLRHKARLLMSASVVFGAMYRCMRLRKPGEGPYTRLSPSCHVIEQQH